MSNRGQYPLEAALRARKTDVHAAEQAMAAAQQQQSEAAAAVDAAQAALERYQAETGRVMGDLRISDGVIRDGSAVRITIHRAADLARRSAYRRSRQKGERRLEAELAALQSQAADAQEAAESARLRWVEAQRELETLERHHERWQAAARKSARSREEERAEENARSRRPR